MRFAHCLKPSAACLLAVAPLAQAADTVYSGDPATRPAHVATDTAGIHAGYHAALGPLDVAALVRYDTPSDVRPGAAPGANERGALSAGVGWRDLYARYDYTFTHDYLGAFDTRGSHYLDIGARHALGDATWLHLNAGNGRTAGNALWDWRDLRAGFTRKLDDGWTMALNYRRVFGNTSLAERNAGTPRFEGLMPGMGRGRRGLVLTFNRGF